MLYIDWKVVGQLILGAHSTSVRYLQHRCKNCVVYWYVSQGNFNHFA